MSGYIGTTPVPQATQHREAFTANANQTTFATAGYTVGYIDVWVNGVKLAAADVTVTNGSDIVLASAAAANDIVEYLAFVPFEATNQTFTGATVVNSLNLNGDGATVTGIKDEDNMASNSANKLATQQSIKAYVDTTVGATNEVVEDTTPQLGGDLASNGNDILMADNDKAIFGAELEIYSDATHARIREYGSGQLKIQGDNMQLLTSNGASTYLEGNASTSAVTLYHASNAPKLATTSTGIDVTGTVTADGINSSGNFTFTAADGMQINAKETVVINIDSDDNDSSRAFTVRSGATGSFESLIVASEDAGVTLYYDNAAKLATTSTGIDVTGTVNSTGEMRITNPSATSQLYLYGASGQKANIILNEYGVRAWHLGAGTYTSGKFSISDGTTERLVIDASGNVGIGTSSPNRQLNIENTLANGGGSIGITSSDSSTSGSLGIIHFGNSTDSSLASIGGLADGSTSAGALLFKTEAAGGAIEERMRIDSSGNVLVGKTTDVFGTAGIALRGTVADFTRDGGTPINVNRLTNDGSLITLHKDGTAIGSIGTEGGDSLYVQGGSSSGGGLLYHGAAGKILPLRNGASIDATIDLGQDSRRFKDLYLSGGVEFGGAVNSGGVVSSSNTLDDYEEGTWTPTIVGGTQTITSIQVAHYTKIGRLVTLNVYIQLSNVTDATILSIGGLPFTADHYGATNIVNTQYNGIDKTPIIRSKTNTTTADVIYGNGNQTAVTQTDLNGNFIFTLTYEQV